jgi:HAD superfamily hydrolase (TIGR01509 family)
LKNHDTQFSAQPRYQSAPDIYLESARRLGASPQLCVAIEDSDAGALAANRFGVPANP